MDGLELSEVERAYAVAADFRVSRNIAVRKSVKDRYLVMFDDEPEDHVVDTIVALLRETGHAAGDRR